MKKRNGIKVLFVISATNQFTHYKSIIINLSKQGHFVTCLFDKEWSQKSKVDSINISNLKIKNFKYSWLRRREDKYRQILFITRELLNFRRYLIFEKEQSFFYLNRAKKYLPFIFRELAKINLFKRLIKSGFSGSFLKLIDKITPADQKIADLIRKYRPDVVMAGPGNIRYSEEIEYIKAAKKLNIPTIIPIISWDNLTTKSLISNIPDRLLVWNQTQQNEAIRYHNIPKNKIRITGSPFFDKWFNNSHPSQSQVNFCSDNGLNEHLPTILYLGSSATIALDETWLVTEIKKAISNYPDKYINKTQIIVRPHPMNYQIYKNIGKDVAVIIPKEGSLVNSKKDLEVFINCVKYSIAAIGINTSAMIDTLVLNKPVIAILDKKYSQTQSESIHFQQMKDMDVLEIAKNVTDIPKIIQKLSKEDSRQDQRMEFIKKFIRPFSLTHSAGLQAVKEIENLVYG